MGFLRSIKCSLGLHRWTLTQYVELGPKEDEIEVACIDCGVHKVYHKDKVPFGAI